MNCKYLKIKGKHHAKNHNNYVVSESKTPTICICICKNWANSKVLPERKGNNLRQVSGWQDIVQKCLFWNFWLSEEKMNSFVTTYVGTGNSIIKYHSVRNGWVTYGMFQIQACFQWRINLPPCLSPFDGSILPLLNPMPWQAKSYWIFHWVTASHMMT